MPGLTSLRDSLYLSDDPEVLTFMHDSKLPSLPVPELKLSVAKLLDSIKPVACDEEAFERTRAKAKAFLSDPNVAELQQLLIDRAEKHKNWLEEWWLEFAYLRSRKPLVPYSNMSAPLPVMQHWPVVGLGEAGHDTVRIKRAALSTFFQLCFWRMLRGEQMRPMIHKGAPWSMSQFKHLFNTVRLPGEPKDELKSWFRTAREGPPESLEVIVLHKGHVFAIKPASYDAQSNSTRIMPAPEIERLLAMVEASCRERSGPGVGALTTRERSEWTEARAKLARVSERNQSYLDRIERALWVLVLDEARPRNEDEAFRLSMCGDARNRWADKSITSIAFKNGTFGASADHTPYDGFCTGIMTHYMITSIEGCSGEWHASLASSPPDLCMSAPGQDSAQPQPELLEFQLSSELRLSVEEACEQHRQICSTIVTSQRTFGHFGKALLKEHRVHPEAFVQCAIHAAYYRLHGKMAPAYVTASTRRFYNGRTETCRSCCEEMDALARFVKQHGSTKPAEALGLLTKAASRFQALMDEACKAQGCDRHLLGLYLVALLEGKPLPELFEDELVQQTNNYVLSTSCNGYWNVVGGVPPLVEHGYGCFYAIEDNAITICCTAYATCAETDLVAFCARLERTLVDLQKVLLAARL